MLRLQASVITTTLCFYFWLFEDWVSCSPGWPQAHYVAEDDPELQELQIYIDTLDYVGQNLKHYLVERE